MVNMMHKVNSRETTEYHLVLADWTVMDIFQCISSGLLQGYTHAGCFCFISITALICNTACNVAKTRVVWLHRVNVVLNMLECQVRNYKAGWGRLLWLNLVSAAENIRILLCELDNTYQQTSCQLIPVGAHILDSLHTDVCVFLQFCPCFHTTALKYKTTRILR